MNAKELLPGKIAFKIYEVFFEAGLFVLPQPEFYTE